MVRSRSSVQFRSTAQGSQPEADPPLAEIPRNGSDNYCDLQFFILTLDLIGKIVYILHIFYTGSVAEWSNARDCKSRVLRLRWFESTPAHLRSPYIQNERTIKFNIIFGELRWALPTLELATLAPRTITSLSAGQA